MQNSFGDRKYVGMNFLLIEDQPEIANMLRLRFEKEGAEVYIGINGTEGLHYARTYKPNMIILDVTMPGIDGVSLYRQLQEDEKTRNLPVVFLTAAPDRIRDEEGLNFPEKRIFEKPFSFAHVFSSIDEILNKNKS